MSKRKTIITLAVAAAAIAGVAKVAADQKHTTVTAVDRVDITRYIGKWYEQASFPMFFQRKCASNTEANYSIHSDGKIDVLNRCTTKDGEIIEAHGTAKTVPGSTSKLKVRFAPDILAALSFVWADYWVIGLDENYRWAVVGTPNRKYLWLLSRDRNASNADYAAMIEIARLQGFDISKLKRTTQNNTSSN